MEYTEAIKIVMGRKPSELVKDKTPTSQKELWYYIDKDTDSFIEERVKEMSSHVLIRVVQYFSEN